MFDALKRIFLRTPPAKGQRAFAAARPGRLNDGWTSMTSSADMESVSSLATLRNRSRALIRDNAHAKRAQQVVVNNVIGTGIGLQAGVINNRKSLVTNVNEGIEAAWEEWCKAENCHIGGSVHFSDMERLLIAEWFAAGEVFIRIHRTGFGAVPLSLEVIEAERMAEEWEAPNFHGNIVRQGVECDQYNRPVAYWMHEFHPGDPRRPMVQDRIIRVPAEEIIHLRIVDRWPQVRGVPVMHAGMSRLHQLGEFQDAAVVAARIGAEKVMILKETEDGRFAETLEQEKNDGTLTWSSGKGQVDILPAGTEPVQWDPRYPDTNFAPFVNAALRDIAAAFGISYESLTGDFSQSNYSSSRMGLLSERDGWRVLQQWYIRTVRDRLHAIWLEAAILSRAIGVVSVPDYVARPSFYRAVTWKPRGWSWVDPTKEVAAYKEAEKAGYITKGDIIAQTGNGRDLEDVIRDRRRELDMLAEAEILTDTDLEAMADEAEELKSPGAENGDGQTAANDPNDAETAQPRLYSFKRDYE